ncbi:MAG: DUF998 domain-containing protein [Streptosporangiaceae bacterium]
MADRLQAASLRASPHRGPLTRRLLYCGAAAGPLFVAVFVVEGARRAGYKPLRHPVSSLSLGPHGWVQVATSARPERFASPAPRAYPGRPPPSRAPGSDRP